MGRPTSQLCREVGPRTSWKTPPPTSRFLKSTHTSPNSHNVLFQLMAGISWLLAEASKCPGVDYMYDGEPVKTEEGNDTLEVMEYEYDYDVESPR